MGRIDSKSVINQCLSCIVEADRCNGRYPYCPGNTKKLKFKTTHGTKIKMIERMIKNGYRRDIIRKELSITSNELGSFISVLVKTGRITKQQAINSREQK